MNSSKSNEAQIRGGNMSADLQRAQHQERLQAYIANPRLCPQCDGPILPKEGSLLSSIARSKFCSHSCAAKCNNTLVPKRKKAYNTKRPWRNEDKPCKGCGALTRNREYCTNKCQYDNKYRVFIEEWKAGLVLGGTINGDISRHVRRYLYETRGEKCEICGWCEVHPLTGKVPVEVHHLGKYNDHREEMLQILCPNHHVLTNTYRSLNNGSGRQHRRST